MMGGLGGFGNVGIRSSYQNQRSLAVSGGLTLGEGGVFGSVGLDGGGRGERPCPRCDLTRDDSVDLQPLWYKHLGFNMSFGTLLVNGTIWIVWYRGVLT